VRQSSKGCQVAQLEWCSITQFAVSQLAVGQASIQFSSRYHKEVLPTEPASDEKIGARPWQLVTDQ